LRSTDWYAAYLAILSTLRLSVGPGRTCSSDGNCGGGSTCKNGICQCVDGLTQSDSECVRGFGRAGTLIVSFMDDATMF
jgi:hypothetical protein